MVYIPMITVHVSDLERAKDFYLNVLGFRLVMDQPNEDGSRWLEVRPGGGLTAVALLPIPPGAATRAGPEQFLNVDSLPTAIEGWKARGLTFTTEVVEHPWASFISFRDPDGNLWTVSELKPT
jgi:catechol 2,3-dioxygenase-like lactoylglutathione lyase family enzyme